MNSDEDRERLASEKEFLATQQAMIGKIVTAFTSAGLFSGGAGGSSVDMIFDADSGRWEAPPSVHVNTIHHRGSAGGGGGAYPAQPVATEWPPAADRMPQPVPAQPHVPTYAEARLKWTETGDVTWLAAMEDAWSPVAERLWDSQGAEPGLVQRGDWTPLKAYGLALLAGVVFWTGILALILW